MSYKFYGRLIGKISTGAEALINSTPSDTTTPFNEQSPGTKFMAYGEDATSLAFNRALGALASNIDSLSGIFGSPALRSEMLRPATGPNTAGFASLVKEPSDTSQTIELGGGADSGIPHNAQPLQWVYCGFKPTDLEENTKLFHIEGELQGQPFNKAGTLTTQRMPSNYTVSAKNCLEHPNANSYFADGNGAWQEYTGGTSGDQGIPWTIPPISRTSTAAFPYLSAPHEGVIQKWDSDGLYFKDKTSDELGLRPGVFIEVKNSGDQGEKANDGLFRIERIVKDPSGILGTGSGCKLILSSGNLHRVTVEDMTDFNAGELVSWQSTPDHGQNSDATPGDRTNFAHVMYITSRPDISITAADLYLSATSGPDLFSEAKVSHQLSQLIGSVTSYGEVGLADQEVGADQNNNLPVGTLLYNLGSTKEPANPAVSTSVTAVVPAGSPVVFLTTVTPGQYFPCNPPGFLLNPVLDFGYGVLPGNNFLWAKTLTTVREQLITQTGSYMSAAEDAKAEPYQTRQDVIATEILLNHLHYGGISLVPSPNANKNLAKTPTYQILGPSMVTLQVSRELDPNAPNFTNILQDFGEKFTALGNTVGKDHVLLKAGSPHARYIARLVDVYDHDANNNPNDPITGKSMLVLTDVTRLDSFLGPFEEDDLDTSWKVYVDDFPDIEAYDIDIIELTNKLADEPSTVQPSKGTVGGFIPSFGLNAAFHAHFSASEAIRGKNTGYGNIIWVPGGTRNETGKIDDAHLHRPFTTVLEGIEPHEVGHLVVTSNNIHTLIESQVSSQALLWSSIRYDGTLGDGSLTFFDSNTRNPTLTTYGHIAFSSDEKQETHVPMHTGFEIPSEVQDQSILGALESAIPGNYGPNNDSNRGENSYGLVSNGVLWGAEAYFEDSVVNTDKPLSLRAEVNGHNVGAWIGTEFEVAISEAYFIEGGAKNHVPPQTVNIEASVLGGGEALIFWNCDQREYQTISANSIFNESPGNTLLEIPDYICIARVKHDSLNGKIQWIQDCRQRISQLDKRTEIYVGRTSSDHFENTIYPEPVDTFGLYHQGGMTFPSIGSALAAIGTWSRNHRSGKKWTIKVVGHTVEANDVEKGLFLPYKLPCDSITIEGVGGVMRPFGKDPAMGNFGVDQAIIHVNTYEQIGHGLFDINGRSNVRFSNLAIKFLDLAQPAWSTLPDYGLVPENNVFENNVSPVWQADCLDYGNLGDYGRQDGEFYPNNQALQENILIEDVHVAGPHNFFFFAGRRRDIDDDNSNEATNDDVPFDNLVINRCSQRDGRRGFVQIAPSNALMSLEYGRQRNHILGGQGGHAKPYYWTNISITNCLSIGRGIFDVGYGVEGWETRMEWWEDSLWSDAIHLAACKEVVVRDNSIREHFKGIVFGPGNGSHYSAGVIENNTIDHIYTDAIVAISDADSSGISIRNNRITRWGIPFNTPLGQGPLPRGWDLQTRPNRHAAIRVAGNDISVTGNTLVDSNPEHSWEQVRGMAPTHTQCILISDDLAASSYLPNWQTTYLYGIRIQDNNALRQGHSGVFLRNNVSQTEGLMVTNNTFKVAPDPGVIAGWDPQQKLTKSAYGSDCHPFFFIDSHPDAWFDHAMDPMAIISFTSSYNNTFSGNTLDGHVALGSAFNVDFSSNHLTFPTTFVETKNGTVLNLTDNTIDNGTLHAAAEIIKVTGNNFSKEANWGYYADVYRQLDITIGKLYYPGINVDLLGTSTVTYGSAIISGNTTTDSPVTLIKTNGDFMNLAQYKGLPAIIDVSPTSSDANILITDNTLHENGTIKVDLTADTTVSNNIIESDGEQLALEARNSDAYFVDEGANGYNHSANVATTGAWPIPGWNIRINGWSGLSINNNVIKGDVLINGCHNEFVNFNALFYALFSGDRPDQSGDEWPLDGVYPYGQRPPGVADPTVVRELPETHNRYANVALRGNTILGNVDLMALNDVTFSDNRLPGVLAGDHKSRIDDSNMRNFFAAGQVSLVSCKRLSMSSCTLGSIYSLYSSGIRVDGCRLGQHSVVKDLFGNTKMRSIGTFAPLNAGRIFGMFTNHLSITNCDMQDATADRRPVNQGYNSEDGGLTFFAAETFNQNYDAFGASGSGYMNNPDHAVYSSERRYVNVDTHTSSDIYFDGVSATREKQASFSQAWADDTLDVAVFLNQIQLMRCQAATISGCHVGAATMLGCDDLKITNNRFYLGGTIPKHFYNLKVVDSSLRPNIQDNHFTASIYVGDPGMFFSHNLTAPASELTPLVWEGNSVGMPSTWDWTIKLEAIVRFPVTAVITGNRFDSAMGPSHDSWRFGGHEHPAGYRYGCGNIEMFNYGGSLIQGNHMMRGHHAYMMEAAEKWWMVGSSDDYLDSWFRQPNESDDVYYAKSLWRQERYDKNNRIGGIIKLDSDMTYNPAYYTKGAVFWGPQWFNSATQSHNDEMRFYNSAGPNWWYNTDTSDEGGDLHPQQVLSLFRLWMGRGQELDGTTYQMDFENISSYDFTQGLTQDDSPSPAPRTERFHRWWPNAGDPDPQGTRKMACRRWGGIHAWDWFATPNLLYANARYTFDKRDENGQLTVSPTTHFPKTLGCFVIGNICKYVDINKELRNTSWAYAKRPVLAVDGQGRFHAPAEAYEVPLNPQHAENHVDFNMVRTRHDKLSLSRANNLGQLVTRSSPTLRQLTQFNSEHNDFEYGRDLPHTGPAWQANNPGTFMTKTHYRFDLGGLAINFMDQFRIDYFEFNQAVDGSSKSDYLIDPHRFQNLMTGPPAGIVLPVPSIDVPWDDDPSHPS